MIKNDKIKQSRQDLFDSNTPTFVATNHSFDFIINRFLIEIIDPLTLKDLDDFQFEDWKEEIRKNMRNELLEDIS
jgi:hypothetical protein